MGDGQNYAMHGHCFSKFRNAMPLVLQHRPCGAICSSKSALRGHLFLKIGPAGPFVLTNQPCGATNYANLPNGLNITMIGCWFIKTDMGASGVFNASTTKPLDQQVGPAVYHATISQHPVPPKFVQTALGEPFGHQHNPVRLHCATTTPCDPKLHLPKTTCKPHLPTY